MTTIHWTDRTLSVGDTIAELIRQRDQARAIAVELEQENAMLRDDLADWRLTR